MPSFIKTTELQEEIYHELIDKFILGIAIIQDKKLIYANRYLAEMIGYSLEDVPAISSDDFMSMIYPDDRNRILGGLIDGISSNKLPLRQEFRIIRKNGDIIWADVRANFIEFQGNSAMQVTFMDITSRKNAESQVNATKEEYFEMLGSISDGFLALDEDLKISYFNKAAELQLGRAASEVVGRNIIDAFPEFKGSIFEDTCTWAAKEKQSAYFETYFGIKPYENWYDIRIYPKKNGISVFFQVITDRKAAEKMLRQSEEQYRRLFETMAEGAVYQDADGKIISANPAAERILGLSLDQMMGRTSTDHEWKTIHEDGSEFPGDSHPSMIALATGKAILNTVMGVFNPMNNQYIWLTVNAIPEFQPGDTKPYRVYTTFSDFTNRKKAEDALSKNLELLAKSQEIGRLGNWTLNFDTGEFEASEEALRIYGLVPGATAKLDHVYTLIHPDDLDGYRKYVESVRLEGRLGGIDYRIVLHDGSVHYVHALTSDVVRDQYGRVKIASGIAQDITERKQNEEQLRKTLESIGDGFISIDADWRIVYFNSSAENILGIGREEILGRSLWDVFPKTLGTNLEREYRLAAAGEIRDFENLYEPLGRWFYNRCYPREGGGISVYFQDITERKQSKEAIKEKEAKYRLLAENMSDVVWILNVDTMRFTYVSPSVESLRGYTHEEVLAQSIDEIVPPASIASIHASLQKRLQGFLAGDPKTVYQVDAMEQICKDGSSVWTEVVTTLVKSEGGIYVLGVSRNIAERKQVEDALKKSEQKFRSIVESSEEGISLIDDGGNIVEWNSSLEYITGLKRGEVLGRPAWDIKFKLIPQEQQTQEAYEKLKSFLIRLTDKGRVALKGWISEQEIQLANGKRKNIHEVIFPIKTDRGFNIGVITHDITERIETEKSLKVKDSAIESALNAMSLANPSGDLFYVNESWLKMMGYERGEIEGQSLLDFLQDPKDADEIEKQISSTGKWEGELVAKKKDGSTMDIHLSASVVKDNSDKPICIISSFIDISESKKIYRKLMESEYKLKAIFDLVPIGIYVVNEDGRVIEANQSFINFMGLSLEELYQKKHWDRRYFSADGTVLPNPMDIKDNSYKNFPAGMVMQEKKPSEHFEIGMEKENGEIVWTSTMAVPVPISDWAALCAAMDITEERKMEESLRITNTAIEDSITAIAINDLEGNLTYVNSAALNMWGYKKEEALGKHAREFWKYPKKIDEVIDALFKIGSWSGDMVGKKKDGSIFDIYLSANIARNAARKPLCLVSSSLDITDRKKMERELKEREERFRKIFELSPIGIQLFDVEGFLVSANQASQKIMGVTDTVKHKRHNIFRDVLKDAESQLKLLSGQIITEGAWIKINPEKAVKLQKLDKDALPNKIERIYIENIAATLGEANKPDGYICIQRDLTEHRLASEAMMSENERLQIIYDIWKTRVKTSDLRMND